MTTTAEENYLKAIFKIEEKEGKAASTNAVAAATQTTAASVTDMLKRLAEKGLIAYEKYRGVQLTEPGSQVAVALIRRHRLWEVFLVNKLGFAWDEVHDMAEQLEHVQGDILVTRLDAFLDYPQYDPHGDPIPNAEGRWTFRSQILLADLLPGAHGAISGVEDHSTPFLQYLDQLGLQIGTEILLLERMEYDQSVRLRVNDRELVLSEKVSRHLYVKTI